MTDIVSRLQALKPLVEYICAVSGVAGVSVGVIHEARVIFTDNFGFRDVNNELPPDQDTIYYLASLSKSFTATGIANLVRTNSKIDWDTPVAKAWSPLTHEDPEIREKATIVDFLSHRTGLAPKNHIWSQEFARFTLERGEEIRTINNLEKIAPFRQEWMYNNWGYGVADELIEHLSCMSFGRFIKKHVLDPLGLARTATSSLWDEKNVAKPYIALADGTPWLLPEPDGQDGQILSGALAVRSCVRDLLKYYTAFMKAVKADQGGTSFINGTPFVDAAKMVAPHVRLPPGTGGLDGAYGLGWVNVQLPCTLGIIGLNHAFVDKIPVVGKGIKEPMTCYYHQGSANSFLHSVHLLPSTESGVVVLTNSMSHNDAADWIGGLYLETLLDCPEPNDFVDIALSSSKNALALWPGMRKELEDQQIPNTTARPLHDYVGLYFNDIGNYHIEISQQDGSLSVRFHKEKTISYKMTHYHYDTFSWLISHDHNAKVGRFPITRASFYLLKFDAQHSCAIDSLIWIHDDLVLEGERFYKRVPRASRN